MKDASGLPHSPHPMRHGHRRQRFSVLHSSFSIGGSAWGLLAGLAGSLCCLGPSAAVLLGLGSSSALFGLQLDRPLALGGGAVVLLAGVALALHRGHACDVRPPTRWRQPALILAAFALAYGLLGVLVPTLAARREDIAVAAAPVTAPATTLRRATLVIEKMECPPCAASVRSLLKRKPFVRSFVAEEGNQQVIVDYDARQVDARGLMRLLPLRYKVMLISDAPLP